MISLRVNILNLYILIVWFRQRTHNWSLVERGQPNLVGCPLPSQPHMLRYPPKMGGRNSPARLLMKMGWEPRRRLALAETLKVAGLEEQLHKRISP